MKKRWRKDTQEDKEEEEIQVKVGERYTKRQRGGREISLGGAG